MSCFFRFQIDIPHTQIIQIRKSRDTEYIFIRSPNTKRLFLERTPGDTYCRRKPFLICRPISILNLVRYISAQQTGCSCQHRAFILCDKCGKRSPTFGSRSIYEIVYQSIPRDIRIQRKRDIRTGRIQNSCRSVIFVLSIQIFLFASGIFIADIAILAERIIVFGICLEFQAIKPFVLIMKLCKKVIIPYPFTGIAIIKNYRTGKSPFRIVIINLAIQFSTPSEMTIHISFQTKRLNIAVLTDFFCNLLTIYQCKRIISFCTQPICMQRCGPPISYSLLITYHRVEQSE